jgi:hypothetical protein
MATIEQLKTALVNAHNAGDTDAAKVLAAEIVKQQGGGSAPDIGASVPDIPLRAAPKGDASQWSSAREAMDTLTMEGQTKLNSAGGALVRSAFDVARGNGWNWWDNYDKILQEQRDNRAAYNEENPIRSGIGTAAGVALGVARGPMWGRGIKGAVGTGAGYGFVGGSLQDASSIEDRTINAFTGAGTGAVIGSVGYGGGKAVGKGLEKADDLLNIWRAPPEVKAAAEFYKAADQAVGPNNAMSLNYRLAQLGPDSMNADILGTRGYGMGRNAANMSADARQTLQDAVAARKAGQNSRLATDVERASGLPAGNTKNVDALKADAYEKVRPQINKAYQAAREAGKDVPLELFDNVITTPVGKKAFDQALENVTSRAARDPSAGGNLAVLDETKRLLDGWATQGFRSGDPMANVYAETAKSLRGRLDNFLSTGAEYSTARGLRQNAYKADEAFDLGAQLAGNRIPLGLPESVNKVLPNQRRHVARAYGATKVENLLNKASTEGAYNDLLTPQGRKAANAALGTKQGGLLGKALDREKMFNVTNREIVGNSSTARQLMEAAGYGGATTGAGMLLGYDPQTSGFAGLLAAGARKFGPTLTAKLVTENQRAVAPYLARLLTEHGIPPTQSIPIPKLTQFFQRFATAGDAKMAKTLALFWNNEVQNTSRQMNAER